MEPDCQMCQVGQAVSYCKQCRKSMCDTCARKHREDTVFAYHEVLDKSVALCHQHKEENAMICMLCSRLLCYTCINEGVCANHEVRDLKMKETDIANDLDNVIVKLSDLLERNFETYQPLRLMAEERIQTIKRAREDILKQKTELIKEINDSTANLMKEVGCKEVELLRVQRRLAETDSSFLLKKLMDAAIAAKAGGPERTVMVLQSIKDKMPQEQTLDVCTDQLKQALEYVPYSLNCGKIVQREEKVQISWKQEGFADLCDVAFTCQGHVAVTDVGGKRVLLFNKFSKMIADSSQKAVHLLSPVGISSYPLKSAVVVTDPILGKVLFLDEIDLHLLCSVTLGCVPRPYGVGSLSNGDITVTQVTDNVPPSVSIHKATGEVVNVWTSYSVKTTEQKAFKKPYRLSVDKYDQIWVSDIANATIAVFGLDGVFLDKIDIVGSYGLCPYQPGKVIVACSDRKPVCAIYSIRKGREDQLVSWEGSRQKMTSVDVQGSYIAILGQHGLRVYNFKN